MGWVRKSPPERYRPYTPDELAELRRLAGAGMSRARIAEKIGRPPGSVSGVCSFHGIKTCGGPGPQTARPPDFEARIKRMAAEGLPQWQIAKALGVSRNTVGTYCSRHGIRTNGHRRGRSPRVQIQPPSPVETTAEENA